MLLLLSLYLLLLLMAMVMANVVDGSKPLNKPAGIGPLLSD